MDQVSSTINDITGFILQYALILAAIGVLAMALLEAVKKLFKLRERYHRQVLWNWINASRPVKGITPQRVYKELIELTTGVNRDQVELVDDVPGKIRIWGLKMEPEQALFSLELERMMGQVQEAADVTLSNPDNFKELYLFLTEGVKRQDVTDWKKLAREAAPASAQGRRKLKEQTDVFGRLHAVVQRKLDGLQLTAAYRWKGLNQYSAIILGAVLLFFALAYNKWSSNIFAELADGANLERIVKYAVASLIGGFAAPIAKDLVTSLRKVRGYVK